MSNQNKERKLKGGILVQIMIEVYYVFTKGKTIIIIKSVFYSIDWDSIIFTNSISIVHLYESKCVALQA